MMRYLEAQRALEEARSNWRVFPSTGARLAYDRAARMFAIAEAGLDLSAHTQHNTLKAA
jgi:hypothetical protein